MGIKDLLPLLKPAMKEVSLSDYSGKRVGVDGNLWIHRGAYACALDLHLGVENSMYVAHCKALAQLLIDRGIRPVIVFDGQTLGAKSDTSHKRSEQRRQAVAELDQHLDHWRELQNQHEARPSDTQLMYDLAAAKSKCEKAAQGTIKVTRVMVERVMAALRPMGVDVLRAPYEADAQLAYLAKRKSVAAVLTEDSDLIAHACPCVLLKLDRHAGTVQRLLWEDIPSVRSGTGKGALSLAKFDEGMFLELCILIGCDYLESPKKFGIKSALKLMSNLKEARRVIRHLRQNRPGGVCVPDDYADNFVRARITFRHQRVWSPQLRKLVHLNEPLPDDFDGDIDACCGADMPPAEAGAYVHPNSAVPADDPFSKALPMPAGQPLPNPMHVHRRASPNRRRSRSSPTRRGSPAARHQRAGGSGIGDEAEALLRDVPGSASKYPRSHLGQTFEQFDDEDYDEEGSRDELMPRGAARPLFDPAYAQPVPPVPLGLDDAEEDTNPSPHHAPAGFDAGAADDHVDHIELAAADHDAGPSSAAYGWGDDAEEDDSSAFHEPSVEELVSQAAGAPPAPAPDIGAPSPAGARLGEALRPSKPPRHASALLGALNAADGDGAMPLNPFAGAKRPTAAKAARPDRLPPGAGKIDALHPFGSVGPHVGGVGSGAGANGAKRARTTNATATPPVPLNPDDIGPSPRKSTTRRMARAAAEAAEANGSAGGASVAKRLRTAAPVDRRTVTHAPAAPAASQRRSSLLHGALAGEGKTPVTAGAGAIGKKHAAKVPASTKAKTSKAVVAPPRKSVGGITNFFGKVGA